MTDSSKHIEKSGEWGGTDGSVTGRLQGRKFTPNTCLTVNIAVNRLCTEPSMRERSTKCTLYSIYVTPDDPRGASTDPAGTRRGPLGRTTYHDRTHTLSQHASKQSYSQHFLESRRARPRARQHAPRACAACSRTPHTSRPSMRTRWRPLRDGSGAKRYL